MSTGTIRRPEVAAGRVGRVELSIGGMTCASCAARIEKKLNRLDGVTATVKLATEKARVSFPAAVSPADLISVVTQAGYTAALPAPPSAAAAPESGVEEAAADETAALRQRLLVSLALAVPVVVLAMAPVPGSATASTTPPRLPRLTWAWPWAPAPTPRSRPAT